MTLDSVIGCLPTLKKLSKAKTIQQRKKILANAKKCLYYSISEIAMNVLNSNIPLSVRRKKARHPYRNHIRLLSRKSGIKIK